MRLVTWPMMGLAALSLAATAPMTAVGLMGVGLLWIGRRRLLGVALAGSQRSHRGGSVTTPGDPPASGVLRHRVVTLARDWWLELAVVSSIWWLPLSAAGAVASFCLLGVFGLAARTDTAQTLAQRNVAWEALIGGAAAVADVFERQRIKRGWRRGTVGCGMPTPRIRSLSRSGAGWRLDFQTAGAWAPAHYERAKDSLASALRCRQVRLRHDSDHGARGTAYVMTRDPLAESSGPWPGAPGSLWEPVPVAVDEQGEQVTIRLCERHVLLGGQTGAGKSNALSMLVAAAAADPDARLWLIDAKRVELAPWRHRAEVFASSIEAAVGVLEALTKTMHDRYAELEARGRRNVTRDDGLALHVLFVDELALLTQHPDAAGAKTFVALLTQLVRLGRAAGVVVVCATQRPSVDAVPGSLRAQFSLLWALRCQRSVDSDTILGQGMASEGFDASAIAPSHKGGAWLHAEEAEPVRVRAYHVDDDQLAALVAAAGPRVQKTDTTHPDTVLGHGWDGEGAGPTPADPQRADSPSSEVTPAQDRPFGVDDGRLDDPPATESDESTDLAPCQQPPDSPLRGGELAHGLGTPGTDGLARPDRVSVTEMAALLAEHLSTETKGLAELARAVGRPRTDGSVRRALALLTDQGRGVRDGSGWRVP